MASDEMYSVEEVLSFTVKDIAKLSTVKVRGWANLTAEQREECRVKLRDLVRQRDELDRSEPVEADALDERLRQISPRSRQGSPSSAVSFVTPPPDGPEIFEGDLQIERESYHALVDEGGIPSHSIELGFDILDDPGEYKEIISFWKSLSGIGRLLFTGQLRGWRKFRDFQHRIRRYHTRKGTFSNHQQKVRERRQRHRLEGDMTLCENQDEQSSLTIWMEYQDYHIQISEGIQKELQGYQERLDAAQKRLDDAGIPRFEYNSGNFGTVYALCVRQGNEKQKAWEHGRLVEKELNLAEKRLKAAQSEDFGETVRGIDWINLFVKEIQPARARLEESEKHKKREPSDLQVCKRWVSALTDMELAEAGVEAARLDTFGETVERPTLVNLIRKEIRSAQARLEESNLSEERIALRDEVLSALNMLSSAERSLKQQDILLEWIEQQRRIIASEPSGASHDPGRDGDRDQAERLAASWGTGQVASSNGSGLERKKKESRSVLGVANSPKVSRTKRNKSTPRQTNNGKRDLSPRSTEDTTLKSQANSKSTRRLPPKEGRTMSPGSVCSSRVSKTRRRSDSTMSTALHVSVRKSPVERHRNKAKDTSNGRGRGQKGVGLSGPANTQLRRSTRVSKKPERFCPG